MYAVQPPYAEGWSFLLLPEGFFYYEAVKMANVAFDPDTTSLDSSSWRRTQWGMKQPSKSMKQWRGSRWETPTSNRTDSIRSYKSSERRAQKDFERWFFFFFFPVFRTDESQYALVVLGLGLCGVGWGWQHVTAACFEVGSGVHWLPSREATWHGLAGNWITDHRCMASFGSEDSA